jgi:hypothetical protein
MLAEFGYFGNNGSANYKICLRIQKIVFGTIKLMKPRESIVQK